MLTVRRSITSGRACGLNENGTNATQFPVLYFNPPNNMSHILSKTVCVKKCPKADNETLECLPTSQVKSCSDLQVFTTFKFLDGFCIPIKPELLTKFASMFSGMNFQSVFQSFYANRFVFLATVGVAFILSYLFSFLLDCCTWIIVIISIVGVFGLGIFISIASWNRYQSLKNEPKEDDAKDKLLENANFYKWVSISLWILLSFLLLMLCCLFDRIVLATHVIQAAADFVGDQTAITMVPVLSVVISFIFFVMWLFGLTAIYSTGEIYHSKDYPWGKIKTDKIK